jgi:hypothetical protein
MVLPAQLLAEITLAAVALAAIVEMAVLVAATPTHHPTLLAVTARAAAVAAAVLVTLALLAPEAASESSVKDQAVQAVLAVWLAAVVAAGPTAQVRQTQLVVCMAEAALLAQLLKTASEVSAQFALSGREQLAASHQQTLEICNGTFHSNPKRTAFRAPHLWGQFSTGFSQHRPGQLAGIIRSFCPC